METAVRQRAMRAMAFLACALSTWLPIACDGRFTSGLSPEDRVIEEASRDRFTLARLSRTRQWHGCTATDTGIAVPIERCGQALIAGSPAFERLAETVTRARERLRDTATAASQHAAGILELRWSDGSLPSLRRATALLAGAARLRPRDVGILNDLAVAELEAGVHGQDLRAVLSALDAVDRALEIDPAFVPARFNRAMVLDRLHLMATARDAWATYAGQAPNDEWAREAGARRAAVLAPVIEGLLPQSARDSCFVLLRSWGEALIRGDTAEAGQHLALAKALAVRVAREVSGTDRSVSLALAAIDAAPDELATRALARAHAWYGQGVRQYVLSHYEPAAELLERAAEGFRRSASAMTGWAEFYRAASEVNLGEFERADRSFGRSLAAATRDQPALSGKAVWALGVSQVRRANYDDAIRYYQSAKADIARAAEPENEGSLTFVLAEALLLEGQAIAGGLEAYRALRLLSRFRRSSFLSNHLNVVATVARNGGFRRAAFEIMNEAVDVAPSVGKADVTAWALRDRARDLISLGRGLHARVDLDSARQWAGQIGDGRGRDRVIADVNLVVSELLRSTNPDSALTLLDDVVETYRRVGVAFNLPSALYQDALTSVASGNSTRALAKLEEAATLLETEGATLATTESRAAHSEARENVFDLLIELHNDAGRDDLAFAALERGRIAIGQPEQGQSTPFRRRDSGLEGIRSRLPSGLVLIEYAVLADRIVTWTLSAKGWSAHRVPVTRDSIVALVDRFRLESTTSTRTTGDASAFLYDLLVRPVLSQLSGEDRIAIVTDRDLARLSFGALWDRETARYFVEKHVISYAPSAAFLVEAVHTRRRPGSILAPRVLVVGDPLLDPSLSRELDPLPGARREASLVAMLYQRTTLLTGREANRDVFLRHLAAASIVHFAGHAVFNSERPELSFLALSPDGEGTNGMLRAREIGALRLSNIEVAVLSACSTVNPRTTRNGSVAGLAFSFLRAGVPGTVSTLWDVSDESTIGLLVEFHRGLIAGHGAAAALRAAQIGVLRSSSATLRAPQHWGAYIYVGP